LIVFFMACGGLSGDHVEEVKQHDGERVEVAEVEADLRDRHGSGARRTSKSRWIIGDHCNL
jgi:hypothetical protein